MVGSSFSHPGFWAWFMTLLAVICLVGPAHGQLSTTFYSSRCPSVFSVVNSALTNAIRSDPRIAASVLRLFFHDCFVQGCDASVLLDDGPNFRGEKGAGPNAGSLRGLELVDSIKRSLEAACPSTVSCADILAILARDGVVAAGGPTWRVEVGRRDGTTASLSGANNLPGPSASASQLISAFTSRGLDTRDLVALSGAHTFGRSQCFQMSNRLFNFQNSGRPDPSMDPALVAQLQSECPQSAPSALVNFDQTTPRVFDSQYYTNLLNGRGLLSSDQTLSNSGQTSGLVSSFTNQATFFNQFTASMIKLGRLGALTGSRGQIRRQCRFVN